jgi:flagellar biosynthetic protein FliR
MESLVDLAWGQFLAFLLVLTRVSGLVVLAPIYGGNEVPVPVRALLAFTLAVLTAPMHASQVPPMPETLAGLTLLLGSELLIGLTIGFGVTVILSGVQMAGSQIGQASGLSLADVFNPMVDSSVPLFSQVLHLFALAIFVVIGGHRLVMAGLLETFAVLPLGASAFDVDFIELTLALLMRSFELGVRIAAPATTALLLATLVLGLISRTMPQLNVLALGFGLNALILLTVFGLALAGTAAVLEGEFEPMFQTVLDALVDGSPATR